MNKTRCLLYVLVLAGMMLAAGCGNREPERKPGGEPVPIGFAVADMNRDGHKTIKKTVDEHKKNANAKVTWMDAKNDAWEQEKQLDQLMGQKVKAVVLQPVDPARAAAQVERLKQAGISVVLLENLPHNTPADAYIASDHAMAGRLQARFVQEALRRAAEIRDGNADMPGAGTVVRPETEQEGQPESRARDGGRQDRPGDRERVSGVVDYSAAAQLPRGRPLNVVILRGDPGDQMAVGITQACREALQGVEGVKVTGVYDHPGLDPATVPATLGQLQARGETVDVILANDSGLAMAAVDYLKHAGSVNNVLTVGVGADQRSSMALVMGEHDAEVDVQPEMLGQFALEAAVSLAQNGTWQYSTRVENGDYTVPARIVPVRLITAKNAYLLEQRWKDLKARQQQEQGRSGEQHEQRSSRDPGGDVQGHRQGDSQSSSGGGQGKTMLRITTQDGKTMEVEIDGEVQKIESSAGGQKGAQQGDLQGEQGGGAGG